MFSEANCSCGGVSRTISSLRKAIIFDLFSGQHNASKRWENNRDSPENSIRRWLHDDCFPKELIAARRPRGRTLWSLCHSDDLRIADFAHHVDADIFWVTLEPEVEFGSVD